MYKYLKSLNLNCTGCGACVNICSHDAIKYEKNLETDGSLVALIDKKLCVECGMCKYVCPVLNYSKSSNNANPDCYAVWAKDEIRLKSSSGGMFTILANYVLEKNGYICAVAYGDQFDARHIFVHEKKDLDKVRRSKYFQSNIGYAFRESKRLLTEGVMVLFVGTPCQIAGLKAFLQKDYFNLITVDIYCYYTPPYFLFEKYLSENYSLNDIQSLDFRVKDCGWISDIHKINFKDGHYELKREFNDSFQKGYHPRLFMRETCEKCAFAGMPRQGDFSIADFWYIKNFYPNLDDGKGTSCLLVNNNKAEEVFGSLKNDMKMYQKVALDCMKYNRGSVASAHPSRNRFYKLLKTHSFNEAVDLALNEKYDVIVWGIWSERNFGSELTYYALYQWLTSMGLDVLMVERPREVSWKPNEKAVLFKENPYPEGALSKIFLTKTEMISLNNKSDTFIVGSDQIWHNDLYTKFGEVCYLDYIENSKKKIAYASSFGREYWTGTEEETQEIGIYLGDFDHVSVRETSGVEVCKRYFNIDAECVLDPVFMCNKEIFLNLAKKSSMKTPKHYIAAYILDIDFEKAKFLKKAKEVLQLDSNIITDAFTPNDNLTDLDVIQDVFCEDWLRNIIESEFVITDSFHGMCFAIIFKKPFLVIGNEKRGMIRFVDFLRRVNLTERLIYLEDLKTFDTNLLLKQIDFSNVTKIIEREKVFSKNWISSALFSPKKMNLSRYDVLLKKIQNNELHSAEDEKKHRWEIQVHRDELNGHLQIINELRTKLDASEKQRNWEIQVHRDELNGHLQMINSLNMKVEECQKKLIEALNINEEQRDAIRNLERNWLIRWSRKLSNLVKNIVRGGK